MTQCSVYRLIIYVIFQSFNVIWR